MESVLRSLGWSSSRHVLNQISDAVMVLGLDGRIVEMNAELCRRVGYSSAEVRGKRPSIWIRGADADAFTDHVIAACLETGKWRGEVSYTDAAGATKHSDVSAQPLRNDAGEIIAVLSVSRDITEQRLLEEKLRADHRVKAIGKIAGGIAHDFNNLLAIIQGNLELASAEPGGAAPEVAEHIEVALEAARRGASLTHRLLAYSRQQPLAPESLDPAEAVRSLEALLTSSLGEAIELKIAAAPGLLRCRADRRQLETVLLNLAINARDAMPEGGRLTLRIRNAALDGDAEAPGGGTPPGEYACFEMADTGVGMSAEVAERAFDPFFTTKDVGAGSGLGLSMAYGFAKQSGGHIEISSAEGAGTTVRLYLPRAELTPDLAPGGPAAEAAGALAGRRVLVVEDEAEVRRTVMGMLGGLGCDATEAATAAEAEAAVADGAAFDLFLVDVILRGGTNGPALVGRLAERGTAAPTVFMSGHTESALQSRGEATQGVVVLQKPFTLAALGAALLRALAAAGESDGDAA